MIEASRCPSCGRRAIPPEPRCQACRAETEAEALEPEGTVLTYAPTDEAWAALVQLEAGARTWVVVDEEPAMQATISWDPTDQP